MEESAARSSFHHISVLPEAAALVVTDPAGIYVDCTLGGGGHSRLIAERLEPAGRLIGIDRDEAAILAATERLAAAGCRFEAIRSNFSRLEEVLTELSVPAVDGILFDLGVSSHQLDTAERGFSYMRDAALDMRMDRRAALSAYEVVNEYSAAELDRVFHDYGEERWGKRIAEFIVAARQTKPIATTGELVDVIERAIPKAVRRQLNGHPAKRIFQAIRIEVNDELGILAGAIGQAIRCLKPGGRLAVITFHSLEDRIVKETLKKAAQGCVCPPRLPVCVCGHKPEIKLLGKVIKPSAAEVEANPRAASAKLRAAEKLAVR